MLTPPGEELFPLIRKLVGKDDPVILEIGANDGTDTERLLHVFPKAQLYCFEPDPRPLERFRRRFSDNDSVELIEAAVSRTSGTSRFHQSSGFCGDPALDTLMSQGWDYSGSIRRPNEHTSVYPWVTFETTIDVPTLALDDWIRDKSIGKVDFIWADVQGAEEDLVLGAKNTLKNTRYFFTEYSNRELYLGQINLNNLLSLLESFEIYKLYDCDVLLQNRSELSRFGRWRKSLSSALSELWNSPPSLSY